MNRMVDTIPFARVSGTITVQGANILDAETDVIGLRRSVGMVFQNPVPFPKSIYENIAYGLTLCGKEHTWWKRWPQAVRPQKHTAAMMEESTHPIDRQVAKSLKDAALWEEVKDRLDQSAYQLSGGQQQRLCIARAIAVAPTILLLDEPCSELDPISTHRIEQTLLQLKAHYTIVIVTHNLQQARRISDHTAFFHAGKLVEFARTKELFEQPKEQLTKDYVQGNFG
jgi:phosphate transport system ATP-binding protein